MEEEIRNSLQIGSRCRLSALGSKRCPKLKSRTGVIVGISITGSSFRIVLEGRRQPVTLHASYIEPETGDVPQRLAARSAPPRQGPSQSPKMCQARQSHAWSNP